MFLKMIAGRRLAHVFAKDATSTSTSLKCTSSAQLSTSPGRFSHQRRLHVGLTRRAASPDSGPEIPSGKSGSSQTAVYGGITIALLGGVSALYYQYYGPGAVVPAPGGPVKKLPNAVKTKALDYHAIYKEIAAMLDEETTYDDGSYGPVLLRLAWHASGTYNKDDRTGGSNKATMRFHPESQHGGNAGLGVARQKLEKIRQKYPDLSYGDLWTLAGVCAIQQMGGPTIKWRPGRLDGFEADCTPDGRLPDGAKGPDHIRDIFYRMGWNDQEIVALSGAHALGRCHPDRSGFEGPWTPSPTMLTNDYFKRLLNEKWILKQWKGPKQYVDAATKELMMLPTDLALIEDKRFRPYVEAYAKSEEKFFDDFALAVSKLFELGVPFKGTETVYTFDRC